MLSRGCTVKATCEMLKMTYHKFRQYLDKHPEFLAEYKETLMQRQEEELELVKAKKMPVAVYIFRCKTVYKNILEQEEFQAPIKIENTTKNLTVAPSFDFEKAIRQIKSRKAQEKKISAKVSPKTT